MYGGEAMDINKSSVDPYADPPAGGVGDVGLTSNATNGDHAPMNGDRGRSRSRSRSPGRGHRSPRRNSPGGGYRRRSPPPPRRPPHAPQAPQPSQVLGVFGLSIRTVERQLDEEFSRYGRVEKVTIVYDARTGRSRGFGFIRMSTVEEASSCIEKLNGIEIDGRRLRVDYSVTERPHNPTPGEYMGTRRDPDRYRGSSRYDRDHERDYGSSRRDRDRDRGDRDYRGDRDRDRDRDPYGRDSYRDWRDSDRGDRGERDRGERDRDRDRDREWRRSPRTSPRRRRSHSRSPVRGSSSKDDVQMRSAADGERAAPRW